MKTKIIIGVMMLFASVVLCGCSTKIIDYRHYLSEWEYINNSSYDLEIHYKTQYLTIPAGQTGTTFQAESERYRYALEDVTETPFDAEGTIITLNGERTVTCPAICDAANYSVTEIKDNADPDLLYRFTYTFTDADFE